MRLLTKAKLCIIPLSLILMSTTLHAENLTTFTNSGYNVCFTPGENCTQLIVNAISKANKTIYVQAYSFTSAPIAKALIDAKRRGVNINVILDKSQIRSNSYSASKFLLNQGVPVWIDYKPAIAHNKVMVIDDQVVITGSFNFTKAAQERNAENVLIIDDRKLASLYKSNWLNRKGQSQEIH